MSTRIKPEWFEKEWIVVADVDRPRCEILKSALEDLNFPKERIVHGHSGSDALAKMSNHKSSIVFIDESIGMDAFRETYAFLRKTFGLQGFFLFAVTDGKTPGFVQFAAEARIDGLIFRPFRGEEFRLRVGEIFATKWPNRIVEAEEQDAFLSTGKIDPELFKKALEKEKRMGHRSPLVPDQNVFRLLGMKEVIHPAVTPGKAAFGRVRLSFKAVARNGTPLVKKYPIHALEIDENSATFECSAETWEAGDNISIEAEIAQGEENHLMRIEAKVLGDAGAGLMSVTFDKGNRSRFEAAMKMVAKRFKELKDFFKYAKGA